MRKIDELIDRVESLVYAERLAEKMWGKGPRPDDERRSEDCMKARAELRTALSACVAEWRLITDEQRDGRTYIVGRDMDDWGFVRGYGYFAGKPGSFVSGWVCRGFTDPPGELGLGHPTHYMPSHNPRRPHEHRDDNESCAGGGDAGNVVSSDIRSLRDFYR